jgi:hypothetical protein
VRLGRRHRHERQRRNAQRHRDDRIRRLQLVAQRLQPHERRPQNGLAHACHESLRFSGRHPQRLVVIGLARDAGLDQLDAAAIHHHRHAAARGHGDADGPPVVIGHAEHRVHGSRSIAQ